MVAVLACLTVGCATQGYDRAGKTVQSLQATKAELIGAARQVDGTINTLNRLSSIRGADLTPVYTQLKRDVASIERQAETARWRADAYRNNANVYLDAWSQEVSAIQDDAIRQKSAQRRGDVIARFRGIEQGAAAVRQAYAPLLTELQGIIQYLGQDLTATGVASMQPQFLKARAQAATLRERIGEVIGELDRVSAALAPQAL
jgi:hypothetical protein